MAFSWIAGATLPQWPIQLNDPPSSPGAAVKGSNTTGATLTMILRNKATATDSIGVGTFTNRNDALGSSIYAPDPTDTAGKSGTFRVLVKAVWSAPANLEYWDLGDLIILPG